MKEPGWKSELSGYFKAAIWAAAIGLVLVLTITRIVP